MMMERTAMKTILCYGDSNTWGFDGECGGRFDLDTRWTGRLARLLPDGYRVVEEGLCGRTTAYELPLEPLRNGWTWFPAALASADPVDLLVLMLGTNDRRRSLRISAQESAIAMERYIQLARAAELWGGSRTPQILLISPPELDPSVLETPYGFYYDAESVAASQALHRWYAEVAERYGCAFLNAADYARTGSDGVHMNREGHRALAEALAGKIRRLI